MQLDPTAPAAKPPLAASERHLREELAAAYRLAAKLGMDDVTYTHFTARVPGRKDEFLINPYGLLFSEITPDNLVKIDSDGNILEETAYRVNPAGFVIHSAVHKGRHDACCVMHTHTLAGMAVAALQCGLLPISQIALTYFGRIGMHPYEGISTDLGERERLIKSLGQSRALILQNHGLLTIGRSVGECFSLMYYLDRACKVQISAMSTGTDLTIVPASMARHVAEQYDALSFDNNELMLEWDGFKRMLR